MTSDRLAALIVEDQPFVGMVASDILRESGFQTFHAFDASDAAKMLSEHPEIAVLLTEAQLPGDVNGIELCRKVSAERPNIQLIVGSTDSELSSSDVPSGTWLLHKPYSSGELKMVVARQPQHADA